MNNDQPSASRSDGGDLVMCTPCPDWLNCQHLGRCFHLEPDPMPKAERLKAFEWEALYVAQCQCTDEWATKYEAERDKKADSTLLRRAEEAEAALAKVNAKLIEANQALDAPRSSRLAPIEVEIAEEMERAVRKFPTWPTDPLHALAVLGEEFGELTKEVLQFVYEPHKTTPADIRIEAIQTAAMAIRFAKSLDRYAYRPGEQHAQQVIDHPST